MARFQALAAAAELQFIFQCVAAQFTPVKVLSISQFQQNIGGTMLFTLEKLCCSSGRKNMLKIGANNGTCRSVQCYLLIRYCNLQQPGTNQIEEIRNGDVIQLKKRTIFSKRLDSPHHFGISPHKFLIFFFV
jgi:hypothetical protein